MTPDMNTTLSIITTGANTVCGMVSILVNKSNRNRIIRAAELKALGIEIERVITYSRLAAIHQLEDYARTCLFESYNRITQEDVNSPYGHIALSILNDEARYFRNCVDDFVRLTRARIF